KLRELVSRLPRAPEISSATPDAAPAKGRRASPARDAEHEALYDLLPADHRMSYDMHAVLRAIVDEGQLSEFQENLAREVICADAPIGRIDVGIIANHRGLIKGRDGEKPRFGGIIYTESAEKVAYYIDRCDRDGIPLLFVQDVSGFMVGAEA